MDKMPQDAMVKETAPGTSLRHSADPEADERPTDRTRRRFSLHPTTHMERGRKRPNNDGAFEGSFAGTARNRTDAYVLPWYLRLGYFTDGWTDASIWRAAMVELFATSFQVYLSGQIGITLMNYQITQLAAYIGIYTSLLISIFIYAAAPASGGHLNPTITFASMLCGLCPLPRAVLYITAQTIGAALAGGMLLGSWGKDRAVSHMGGGAVFEPAMITAGQVLVTEIMASATLVFLAIGVGLDPRQQAVFGPQLGPLLVGLAVGLVTAGTSGIAPGYTGANINPARAFGLAVARGSFDYQWIWWVGPALGSMLVALMYNLAPPYHANEVEEDVSPQVSR